MDTVTNSAETEIRALLEDCQQSFRTKDLERIMARYTPDIRAFDAIQELQFKGLESYRRHWQECLAMCSGEPIMRMDQLVIEAQGPLAVAHWLGHCGSTDENGAVQGCWMRTTTCLRRVEGQWKIFHEHWSVPFDMRNGKALLDLEP